MSRAALDWNDERPDVFRARGRSGRLYRIGRAGSGDWWLRVTPEGEDESEFSRGYLADMKALADVDEAGYAPKVVAQRIDWTRIRDGEWWGTTTDTGPAYKVLRIGRAMGETLWRLQAYPNADANGCETLDEGGLGAMKKRASLHAGEQALEPAP